MKKNLVIAAAAAAALCMASCHGNTKSNETDKDSLSTVANDSLNAGVAIESLAGTYELQQNLFRGIKKLYRWYFRGFILSTMTIMRILKKLWKNLNLMTAVLRLNPKRQVH